MSIRPFSLPHDLELMSRLVADGFQYPENPAWSVQPDEVQAMIDRIDSARRLWPILAVMRRFVPLLRDVLCGFIDEQDGRPAGLINYMRQHDAPDWYIANVTVLPTFRRLGIARALVAATLEELRRREARVAVLDVVVGNEPAIRLYRDLGFETFATSIEYGLADATSVEPGSLPEGYRFVNLSATDWRTAFEFARRVTPERTARYEPVTEARFRSPRLMVGIGQIFERLSGSRSGQIAIRDGAGTIVALGRYAYRTRAGGTNSARLSSDPDRPEVAEVMLRHVVATIGRLSPGHRLELALDDWQTALIGAAERLGCRQRYSFERMGLRF